MDRRGLLLGILALVAVALVAIRSVRLARERA
jgi:hypothetical protein